MRKIKGINVSAGPLQIHMLQQRRVSLFFLLLLQSYFNLTTAARVRNSQASELDGESQESIDLLAPSRRRFCLSPAIPAAAAARGQLGQDLRAVRTDSQETRLESEAGNLPGETQIDATQPVAVDDSTASSGFIFTQLTPRSDREQGHWSPEQHRQPDDFFDDFDLEEAPNPPKIVSTLPISGAFKSSLFIFDADFAADPLLADRAQEFMTNQLPDKGIVGKVAEGSYFTFPFEEVSVLNYLATSQSESEALNYGYNLNLLFTTPVKKRAAETCPNAPAKRQRESKSAHLMAIEKRMARLKIPTLSPLIPFLDQLNDILSNLGYSQLTEPFLFAFEYSFTDIFMGILRDFPKQMLLPASILCMIRDEDFDKFHSIRAEFDFAPDESSEFSQRLLLAIMQLPATSSRALSFLSSSVNAPFLFNHLCSGSSNIYLGKFCFEQVASAAKVTEARHSQGNLLANWFLDELKRPFELNSNSSLMAIAFLSFLDVCFETRADFIQFLVRLFSLFCEKNFLSKTMMYRFLTFLIDEKFDLELLRVALRNNDLEGIRRLYNHIELENPKRRLASHDRLIDVSHFDASGSLVKVEITELHHSFSARTVLLLQREK